MSLALKDIWHPDMTSTEKPVMTGATVPEQGTQRFPERHTQAGWQSFGCWSSQVRMLMATRCGRVHLVAIPELSGICWMPA
jgi:hypothetical protein